jgi:hypothetical protein
MRLVSSNIGAEGAVALAKNPNITSLYLNESHIGDDGVIALAKNTRTRIKENFMMNL